MEFDGTASFVTVADSDQLDAGPELTLEAWIYPTVLGGYRVIVDKTTTGMPTNYYLAALGTEVAFGFNTGGWQEHITSGVNLVTEQWTHVAAVYSDAADRVWIYVGGVEVLSEVELASLSPNAEELRIGVGFPSEGFTGRIDEVRVYGRVLTQTEIEADRDTAVVPTP